MFRRILSSTRYLIIIAVLGVFLDALALLFFAAVKEGMLLYKAFSAIGEASQGLKNLALDLIQNLDIFLLAVGFYLIAMGLYELFIDDRLDLPAWLVIHNFDNLKVTLVSIIIVILAVTFLSIAIEWKGGWEIAGFGVSVALVIVALTYFSSVKEKKTEADVAKKDITDLE